MPLSRTQRRRERRAEPLGSGMRVATYIRTGSSTPRRCTYDYMGRRIRKKVEQNGATTLHEGYIYHGYLQIACVNLQKPYQAAERYITWDPTQPTATRPKGVRTRWGESEF